MPIDDLDGEVMITLVQGARWVHCKGRGQGRTQQPGSGAQTLPASATTMNSLQPKSTRKNTDKNFPSLQPGFYLKKKGGVLNKQLGFPSGSAGEGNGNPLQYSCLENPMDGGAQWAAVQGVAESRTRPSDFLLSLSTFMHWRRKWQPTPVILPGVSQGWGSLVGYLYGVTQSRTQLK